MMAAGMITMMLMMLILIMQPTTHECATLIIVDSGHEHQFDICTFIFF